MGFKPGITEQYDIRFFLPIFYIRFTIKHSFTFEFILVF